MPFIQYANESVYVGLRKIDTFENLDELFNYSFQLIQFIFAARRLRNSADFRAEFC